MMGQMMVQLERRVEVICNASPMGGGVRWLLIRLFDSILKIGNVE
jgi:hypothetical protein